MCPECRSEDFDGVCLDCGYELDTYRGRIYNEDHDFDFQRDEPEVLNG